MAENEAARKTGEPVVVSDSPDVCLTPPGVPVPYSIVSYFPSSSSTANSVLFTEDPAFTVASSIPGVIGDEGGCLGGVTSGTFSGAGWVHVVNGAHTPTVYAENSLIVFHNSKMEMNCPSPQGPGNTIGTVLWTSTKRGPWANPPDRAENEKELDKKLDAENPEGDKHWEVEHKSETKFEGSAEGKAGLNAGPFKSTDGSTNVGIEHSSTVETNYAQYGGDNANVQVAHAEAGTHYGAGYSDGNYEATAGADASFKGVTGHAQYGGEGNNVQLNAEALSAQASAEGKATFGAEGAGVEAKAGAEAILAKVSVSGEKTITTQDVLDSSLNKWFGTKWKLPEAIGGTGVVVSGEAEADVGAKAEAKFEAVANKHEVKVGLGAGVAAGLGLGAKGSIGLKLGDGLVDGAVNWVKSWF